MAVSTHQMSADDYLATADSRPRHTELIDGTVVMNEPKMTHARAQTRMIHYLHTWIDAGEGRGYVSVPMDIVVDDRNVFAPDVWWVGEHRRPAADQVDLGGLPDLVVEIRSPSTWARDLGVKLPAYEAAGVAEAWFVDTEARSVLVFRRSRSDYPTFDRTAEVDADSALTSPLLEGFVVLVRSLFEP